MIAHSHIGKLMNRFLLLVIALVLFASVAPAQIVCIYCFDTNDSISSNVTNLIQNGSFENHNCTPNTNGSSYCPNSAAYQCNLTNWTCTGGGSGTYCQIFTSLYSAIPDGLGAAYFGNSFCNPCSQTVNDTSCFVRSGCEISGIPPGFPQNQPNYGGALGLSLDQTVTGLTIGARYVLEFWTGGEDFGVFTGDGVFGLDIGFGYTMLETVPTDFGDIGKRYVVIFDATSTSHNFKWTNWGHICGSCSELTLDHVRLYPVSQLNPQVSPCGLAPYTVTATGTSPLCNNQCTGTATATPNGGIPPYTYAWSGGQLTQVVTGLCPGAYAVTVTDSTGAAASDSVFITNPPALTLTTTATATSCSTNSGTATATAGGGTGLLTYLWSPGGQTTATATGLASGTYNVTVTDDNGCTITGSAVVGTPPAVQVTATSTPASCTLNNGTATATPSGGTGLLSYMWMPGGQTTATAIGLAAGSYSVTVTDANGCTATASTVVTSPAAIQLAMSAMATTCNLDNGSATVNPSGGTGAYTYVWSPGGQTTQTATNLAAGGYSVTVTDAQGCTGTGSITVNGSNGVQAATVGTPSFCEGEGGDTLLVVGSGGALPYYYTWWCQATMGPCGLDSTFDDDPLANPAVSGWYYVQITDGNGCLSNIDSVYLTILPKPIVDAGADLILCGDSAPCQVLTPTVTGAPGPFAYQWIPSTGLNDAFIANPCARPDTTTIYALVVEAGNGCSSTFTTTDTLSTVVVNVNPVPIADAGPDQHICFGDSATLEGIGTNAGPLYTYEWSPFNGLSDPTDRITMASPALTTTYTLVATSNGCPSYGDQMTLFVHTIPTVDAGPDREMCLGDSILIDASAGGDSTASYSFLWTPNASITNANLEDPSVWPVSTTMYYVEAISNYGCGSSRDSVLVTLLPSPIANAGPNATVCAGSDFEFQGSYSYTTTNPANPSNVWQYWTPAAGMSDSTSLTPVISPTASGLYTLTVYTGLCQTQDSMILTVIPGIGLNVEADTNVICEGDVVWIRATSSVSSVNFLWSPTTGVEHPDSGVTYFAPTDTTTYTVVAEGAGCLDSASVTINVIPRPDVAFLNSQPSGCAPLSVNFLQDVADAIFLTWNFGDGTPVSNEDNPLHVYAQPGTYTVTLTGVNIGGCSASTSGQAVVVSDTSRVDFTSDPSFPVELSLPNTIVKFFHDSPNAVTFDWDFGDGTHSDEANPIHTYLQPGNYNVTLRVTNRDGCVSTVVHGPFVILVPGLFIPNVFSPNDDGSNDEFIVQYTGSQPFNLQIFDRWGVKLYEGNNKNKGWKGNDTKGNAVTEGVYFYRLTIGDKDYTGPVTMVR